MSPVSSALIFSNLLYCTCIFTTSLYSALLLRLQLSPSNHLFLISSIPSGFQQTPFLKPLSFGLQLQRFCFCLIQLRDLTPLPPPHKKANKTNSLPHPLSPRTRASGADRSNRLAQSVPRMALFLGSGCAVHWTEEVPSLGRLPTYLQDISCWHGVRCACKKAGCQLIPIVLFVSCTVNLSYIHYGLVYA